VDALGNRHQTRRPRRPAASWPTFFRRGPAPGLPPASPLRRSLTDRDPIPSLPPKRSAYGAAAVLDPWRPPGGWRRSKALPEKSPRGASSGSGTRDPSRHWFGCRVFCGRGNRRPHLPWTMRARRAISYRAPLKRNFSCRAPRRLAGPGPGKAIAIARREPPARNGGGGGSVHSLVPVAVSLTSLPLGVAFCRKSVPAPPKPFPPSRFSFSKAKILRKIFASAGDCGCKPSARWDLWVTGPVRTPVGPGQVGPRAVPVPAGEQRNREKNQWPDSLDSLDQNRTWGCDEPLFCHTREERTGPLGFSVDLQRFPSEDR